jgi:hypothetical protein
VNVAPRLKKPRHERIRAPGLAAGTGAGLADAAERPAEHLGAAARDARGDQPVRGFQLRRFEPDRDHDTAIVALEPVPVVDGLDHTAAVTAVTAVTAVAAAAAAAAAVVLEGDPDVPDLRPPPSQLEPELPQGRPALPGRP